MRFAQAVQKVKKDPYLKWRYNEFSRRHWKAIGDKNEWEIMTATGLIGEIDQEIKAVQTIVAELAKLQKQINLLVDQIKGILTEVLGTRLTSEKSRP